MLRYVAIAIVAPLAIFLGADSSSAISIWDILRDIGLAGIFFWAWQIERKERLAAQQLQQTEQKLHQEEMVALVEKMSPIFKQAVDTLDKVQQGMLHAVEHVSGASSVRSEMDLELRHASEVVGELENLLQGIKKGRFNE